MHRLSKARGWLRVSPPGMEPETPNIRQSKPNIRQSRPNIRQSRPNIRQSRPNIRQPRPNIRQTGASGASPFQSTRLASRSSSRYVHLASKSPRIDPSTRVLSRTHPRGTPEGACRALRLLKGSDRLTAFPKHAAGFAFLLQVQGYLAHKKQPLPLGPP